ncbi:acetyl-CoA carboxylase biotin carboxyl carrier protein subunit [Oceanicoccus sagamiensis]|uniref:Acetyl-CoA carboxylase biotin carboxyl carrier protein subunit n=1 Tax=Oceanicoccus sagamiensis TaxID=716816 RepID=A0A1X9NEK6_9GAMM|nr:acetyl-CoA carboxylase biotin carboxyl carrier protein subunit [Oceanicoccus sagamiensis]
MINIVAEVTGKVWQVDIQQGQSVTEDDTLMIIESMKMEIPVDAPEDGRIVEILVAKDEAVVEGQILARLDIQ